MAKCKYCKGTGYIKTGLIDEDTNGEGLCMDCKGTGTEPQEVAKVELTDGEMEDLDNTVFKYLDNTELYKKVKTIISNRVNTAVLAERYRIMAELPWPYEADNDQGFIDDEEIGYNRCLTEVKKIVEGL